MKNINLYTKFGRHMAFLFLEHICQIKDEFLFSDKNDSRTLNLLMNSLDSYIGPDELINMNNPFYDIPNHQIFKNPIAFRLTVTACIQDIMDEILYNNNCYNAHEIISKIFMEIHKNHIDTRERSHSIPYIYKDGVVKVKSDVLVSSLSGYLQIMELAKEILFNYKERNHYHTHTELDNILEKISEHDGFKRRDVNHMLVMEKTKIHVSIEDFMEGMDICREGNMV